MNALESWTLGYLLNSIWQVPMIFAAGWIAARILRQSGPRMEHRVWVIAMMVEVFLPACRIRPSDLIHEVLRMVLRGSGAVHDEVRVAIGAGISSGVEMLRVPKSVLAAAVLGYGCSLLYFAGRLGWRLWSTWLMEREAERMVLASGPMTRWNRWGSVFGCEQAEVAVSGMIFGPVTVGIRNSVMIVPPGFLEKITDEDLDAVMAHEFAHIQRRDFAKNLAYGLLSLPVAYHPLLWLTRSRVAESREMVCDAMAAKAVAGSESYARSLLRLASLLVNNEPDRTLHAIGIFDANSFERRVMTLSEERADVRGVRRFVMTAVCGVAGLVMCASALALRVEVSGPAMTSTAQGTNSARLTIPILKNDAVYKRPPVYPVEAKATKNTLNGPVVLAVTIDENGVPTDVHMKKSLRADYDESALTAVKEWRWNPYLLNGNPVAVDTTVTVNYLLGK
ncbi:M56 family metallopeptidase [Tunturiibacter gelidoferens]|uniref:TonB family protein n=1 Tax=Tunturiibacter gelidiferens TaxID=3069689 RepID=A0A9X0QER0_9BACT|nr:M56 family metallopeptidase [Edaphobacter lichenicola]MBB5328933.1 TonB family protein [Edaphobacter lichenicola]